MFRLWFKWEKVWKCGTDHGGSLYDLGQAGGVRLVGTLEHGQELAQHIRHALQQQNNIMYCCMRK